jgi:protein ImuB
MYQVGRLEGPERITPEWWRGAGAQVPTRDYYRAESLEGRRFWIFVGQGEQRWYVHGLFA